MGRKVLGAMSLSKTHSRDIGVSAKGEERQHKGHCQRLCKFFAENQRFCKAEPTAMDRQLYGL